MKPMVSLYRITALFSTSGYLSVIMENVSVETRCNSVISMEKLPIAPCIDNIWVYKMSEITLKLVPNTLHQATVKLVLNDKYR